MTLHDAENPKFLFPVGTQVVALRAVVGSHGRVVHPAGAVGIVVHSPVDRTHPYRVRFVDGFESAVDHDHLVMLARFKEMSGHGVGRDRSDRVLEAHSLLDRVIYRCVVGSRAFGLETEESDTDRRGIYLPPADLHWSLYGVPEQLELDGTEECYWELQKFIVMALKANPNILECLYTPIVEFATPLGRSLLEIRDLFLSRLVYQTYNGYVASQFKRMQASLRNQGKVKPKHAMHLIRLLLAGIHILREGFVAVDVGEHRESLLAIKTGAMPWEEIESWRRALHKEFDEAFQKTTLPERPNYDRANAFLVRARRLAIEESLP